MRVGMKAYIYSIIKLEIQNVPIKCVPLLGVNSKNSLSLFLFCV